MAAGQLHEVCDVGNKEDYGQHVDWIPLLSLKFGQEDLVRLCKKCWLQLELLGSGSCCLVGPIRLLKHLLIYRGQQTPHTRKGCFSSPSMCQSSIPWFHLKCALSQKYFILMCTLRYSFPELVHFVTYRIYWFNFLVSEEIVSYCM